MNIIVESHIPFIRGKFEAAGHSVRYLEPEEFTNQNIRQADALVIRTRTHCTGELLANTNIKKIATATIGTDHIDLDYCRAHNIEVFNAPGCNAPAVAQYVLSSINALGIKDATIGIIGVGHVGSTVNRWARANGYRTLLYDPPLGLYDSVFNADVITLHTPLDNSTYHLADKEFFNAIASAKPLIINAARGGVVDTAALIRALQTGQVSGAVIDCWENEPDISRQLLDLTAIATPHIAGYSLEGKQRATSMAIAAIDPTIIEPLAPIAQAPTIEEIAKSYNPMADSAALHNHPGEFENLRNNYTYRNEPR